MLRFGITIDGNEKVETFLKLLELSCMGRRKHLLFTARTDCLIIYHQSVSALQRTEMFEVRMYPGECFTHYVFEYDEVNELTFEVVAENLRQTLLSLPEQTDILTLKLAMIQGEPALQIRVADDEWGYDLGVEMRTEVDMEDHLIPESTQSSLSFTFPNSDHLRALLTSVRYLGVKVVTVSANTSGYVEFKGGASVTHVNVSVPDVAVQVRNAGEETSVESVMSASVDVRAFVNFIRLVAASAQFVEIVIVDQTSARIEIHKTDCVFTLYLSHQTIND
ncbi:hypothetical protein M3Y99_01501100 [Aphelenchoides fujianensis]|nr:hypothetical protein M3Y99_01501100 [Aphelenchoides fujianensis]